MNRSTSRTRSRRVMEPMRAVSKRSRKRLAKLNKTYGPEVLYTFAMPAAADASSPLDAHFQVVEADIDKIDHMKALYPALLSDGKYQVLVDRLKQTTERCYVIEDEQGAVYGYAHMALDDHVNTRINHLVRVSESQVYLFDDHIFKPHRRRGLHAFSIASRLRIAASIGKSQAITIISRPNTASIASYQKFGSRPTSTLVYFPLLRRTVALPVADRVTSRGKR